jgi:anti-sigma-K factor RskA
VADRARIEELAALVAAGAATPDEELELDALAEADDVAAETAAEYADAATLLADSLEPVPPPAHALDRIQAAAADAPALPEPGPAPRPSELHPKTRRVIAAAQRRAIRAGGIATFGLAAAAAFGFLYLRERSRVGDLTEQVIQVRNRGAAGQSELFADLEQEKRSRAALESRLAELRGRYDLLASPRLQLATVRGDRGAVAKIFVDGDKRRWVVFAFELPPVPGRDYQLWFVPADGRPPISAGLLERAPDGSLTAAPEVPADLGDGAKAAISLEPKGGSPAPTMDQIKVIGDLI